MRRFYDKIIRVGHRGKREGGTYLSRGALVVTVVAGVAGAVTAVEGVAKISGVPGATVGMAGIVASVDDVDGINGIDEIVVVTVTPFGRVAKDAVVRPLRDVTEEVVLPVQGDVKAFTDMLVAGAPNIEEALSFVPENNKLFLDTSAAVDPLVKAALFNVAGDIKAGSITLPVVDWALGVGDVGGVEK